MLPCAAMQRSDFDYDLPPNRIAQQPSRSRSASRLLCLDRVSGAVADRIFKDLPQLLCSGDLLILNDTRVIPARLFGTKETGGKVEVLVERVEGSDLVLAHVRANKAPLPGARLRLDKNIIVQVEARRDDLFVLRFVDSPPVLEVLETHGHVPLPPYISRHDTEGDRQRYQTVYARVPGAVAAPTAGLHFDDELLENLAAQGVEIGFITLHVGAGTFQPVKVEQLEDHRMHPEYLEVGSEVCTQVRQARNEGRRVVAVGTTVVRALEAAAQRGEIEPYQGDTSLFIVPGYRFRVIDALLTNFHLPESTLLMLVCAFGGYNPVIKAYQHAIEAGYRFYSYGDAMFVYG